MSRLQTLRARWYLCCASAGFVVLGAGCTAVEREQEAGAPAPVPAQDDTPVADQRIRVPNPDSTGPGDPSATASAPAAHGPISGSLSTRLRARTTGDENDFDLFEVLALDYADPEEPSLSAHFLGRMTADLDGHESQPSAFTSLSDTYDGSVQGQLYQAFVDLTPKDSQVELRMGRQVDYLTPEFAFFDGVRVQSHEVGERASRVGAYGGVPVHFYESSSEGDALLGLFAETHPWHSGRARFDWMHFDDDYLGIAHDDDLFSAGLWQQFGARASVEAQYTRVEQASRDLRLALQASGSGGKAFVRGTYYELYEPQSDQALDLDPFTNSLQQYEPFRRAGVVASTSLGEHAALEFGIDARRVSASSDIGEFNRDWERYYATATLFDRLHPGLTLALTGDQWNGDDRDIGSWGFAATQQINKAWEASAGTYYSLYKYDLNNNTERDDVRTFYARGHWKKNQRLSFDLIYEFEDDDFEQYHVLSGGAIWNF